MTRVREIANTIHPSIQVTIDFPSNHENGRLPCLDTEQWIENITTGDITKPQILHSHYTKPMSSQYVTHKNSAMAYTTKINILANDLVRIMRNISRQCTTNERSTKIQAYLLRLENSYYNKFERHLIYTKAKIRYDKIIKNAEDGVSLMSSSNMGV